MKAAEIAAMLRLHRRSNSFDELYNVRTMLAHEYFSKRARRFGKERRRRIEIAYALLTKK